MYEFIFQYQHEPLVVHVPTITPLRGDTHLVVHVRQPPPERASRQAAERDVRAENGGAGAQRVGRSLGLLEATHPSLKCKKHELDQ